MNLSEFYQAGDSTAASSVRTLSSTSGLILSPLVFRKVLHLIFFFFFPYKLLRLNLCFSLTALGVQRVTLQLASHRW